MSAARREPKVYAMVAPKSAAIKIGMSVSPMARMSGLSTPGWLFLWEVWDGGRAAERAAHEALREHRIRREWFAPHPDVIAYIAERAGCPDVAENIRRDHRYAGGLTHRACSWAALHDEDDDGDHQHGPVSIVGEMRRWTVQPASDGVLVPGLRYGPGTLEAEAWINDVGSQYWVLRNPIAGRRRRAHDTDVAQLGLLP